MPELLAQNWQLLAIGAILAVGGVANWDTLKTWLPKRKSTPLPDDAEPELDPFGLVPAYTQLRRVLAASGETDAVKSLDTSVWPAIGKTIGAVADEPAE